MVDSGPENATEIINSSEPIKNEAAISPSTICSNQDDKASYASDEFFPTESSVLSSFSGRFRKLEKRWEDTQQNLAVDRSSFEHIRSTAHSAECPRKQQYTDALTLIMNVYPSDEKNEFNDKDCQKNYFNDSGSQDHLINVLGSRASEQVSNQALTKLQKNIENLEKTKHLDESENEAGLKKDSITTCNTLLPELPTTTNSKKCSLSNEESILKDLRRSRLREGDTAYIFADMESKDEADKTPSVTAAVLNDDDVIDDGDDSSCIVRSCSSSKDGMRSYEKGRSKIPIATDLPSNRRWLPPILCCEPLNYKNVVSD